MLYHAGISDMAKFARALQYHDLELLGSIKYKRKQEGVTRGWKVPARHILAYDNVPAIPSKRLEQQMVQLYFMACCRDVPFEDYGRDSLVAHCCKHYQYALLRPDYAAIYGPLSFFVPLGKEHTGRDMARHFLETSAEQLMRGAVERLEEHHVRASQQLAAFASSAVEDLEFADLRMVPGLAADCMRRVEDVVYAIKWHYLFPRPDELSRLLLNPQFAKILGHPIVQRHKDMHSVVALTTVGAAPACPAQPFMSLCLVAAAATVISFFYDVKGLLFYDDGRSGCIRHELDRLIVNVAQGHCWAGHQYSIDTHDIQLGEKLALEFLGEYVSRFPHRISVDVPLYADGLAVVSNVVAPDPEDTYI